MEHKSFFLLFYIFCNFTIKFLHFIVRDCVFFGIMINHSCNRAHSKFHSEDYLKMNPPVFSSTRETGAGLSG